MKTGVLAALAAVLVSACAAPGSGVANLSGLADSRWVLAGSSAPVDLAFQGLTQVSGSAGCNRYTGPAKVEGAQLRLGPLAATRRMCPGDAMAVESRVLKALDETRQARIEGQYLVLLDAAAKEVLRLTRQP